MDERNDNNDHVGKNLDECNYLNCVREILERGKVRNDRTGTGTISIFGMQSRYSLRNGFLLIGCMKTVKIL